MKFHNRAFSGQRAQSRLISLPDKPGASSGKLPFILVLLALLVEFGRPQDVLLGLRAVPFPSLIDGLLALAVVWSGRFSISAFQTKLWVGLLGLMFVHVPLATNNYWAAMVLKDMTLLFALFLGMIGYIDSLERLRTLVKMWLGVHLFLAVFGVMNKGSGVGGWLGDENDFCMEMNAAMPFAYFAFHATRNKREKIICLILLGTFVLAGIIGLSRGGFIGLTVAGTYCWMRSSKKIAAVLLVGILILFVLVAAPEEYWDEIQSITSDQTMEVGTGGERLYSWGLGWEMFVTNPILGVGQGNYPWNVGDYEGGRTFNTRSISGRQAHSAYFTLLPELGMVGVLIFLAFVYGVYRDMKFVRHKGHSLLLHIKDESARDDINLISNMARAIEGSLVGYLASSVFISTLYYPTFWVLMAFTVTVRIIAEKIYPPLEMRETLNAGVFSRMRRPVRPRSVAADKPGPIGS
jgi:O-antigen ligase